VLLVDSNMQCTALAAVHRVHLGAILQQQQHHVSLITATHITIIVIVVIEWVV